MRPEKLTLIKEVSKQFVFIENESEVYEIIKQAYTELLPDIPFIICKVVPDNLRFRIILTNGFEKYIDTAKSLIGKDPLSQEYPFSDTTPDVLTTFNEREMYYYENGLYELTNGTISKSVSYAIEKVLGLRNIAAVGIAANNLYYGSSTFYILKKHNLENNRLDDETRTVIEIISNQAATAIQNIRKRDDLVAKDEQLVEGKQRFETLLNNLTDIVWEADANKSNVTDLKNSFRNYFGHNADEFVKNPEKWGELVLPDDKFLYDNSVDELEEKGFSESEYRVFNKNGEIRWLQDRKSIIFDENKKPQFRGGISTDITKRKEIEKELNNTTQKLIESNQTKDKLFSIIAHDLKNPFNALIGFTDILVETFHDIDDDEKYRIISLLNGAAHSAYNLLNNLLIWARIQEGKIKISKNVFSLFKIVEESINPYMDTANFKELKVVNSIPENLNARVDLNTFQTIVRNLFMNAIKYSYPKGVIELSAMEDGEKIYVSVSDQGVGMKPEILDNLFKITQSKCRPGTNNESGTGLGLIISKEFAEQNDGTLSVTSEAGHGSVFTIILPRPT